MKRDRVRIKVHATGDDSHSGKSERTGKQKNALDLVHFSYFIIAASISTLELQTQKALDSL